MTHRVFGSLRMKNHTLVKYLCQFYPWYGSVPLCFILYSNIPNLLMLLSPSVPSPAEASTTAVTLQGNHWRQACRGYHWCRCQPKLPLVLLPAEANINADASPKAIIETKLSLMPTPVRAIWPRKPCCYSTTLAMMALRLVGHTWPRWP